MLRIDDAEMITILGVTQRLNVWTSLLLLVVAVVIFIVLARQPRTADTDSVYLPGRAPTDDVDSVEPAAETAEARQDASTDDDGVPASRGAAPPLRAEPPPPGATPTHPRQRGSRAGRRPPLNQARAASSATPQTLRTPPIG